MKKATGSKLTIPQVDLGIEVKIQNIERTERAKRELLAKGEISTGELPRYPVITLVFEKFLR